MYCPSTHPWAISNGTHCCQSYQDGEDVTGTIRYEDPVSNCHGGILLKCRVSCRTMVGGKTNSRTTGAFDNMLLFINYYTLFIISLCLEVKEEIVA